MSMELEQLLGEASAAGVVFYRHGGRLSIVMRPGASQPNAELLARLRSAGGDINRWLAGITSQARCMDCPHASTCSGDGCVMDGASVAAPDTPGIGSFRDRSSAQCLKARSRALTD